MHHSLRFLVLAAIVLFCSQTLASSHSNNFRVKIKRQSSNKYPPLNGKPLKASQMKPEWKAALDAAVKAGKIPNIPPSSSPDGGTPTYPSGTDMSQVCNWSITQCQGPHDIYQAPDGVAGINFDDGPTEATQGLNAFLLSNNISATRFLIGGQVAGMTDAFKDIIKDPNQQLAVHTYTHHQMTTLSNEQAVAELGWTMQVIYDMSGFIPRLWRGPTGDVDNRIRAIAEEVFGLYHTSWDADSNDWCMSSGTTICPGEDPGKDIPSVKNYIDKTLAGSKTPGVLMLEHELSDITVGFFKEHTWPGIQKGGWNHMNVAEFNGSAWYANAADPKAPKSAQADILKDSSGSSAPAAPASTSAANGKGGKNASGSSSSTPAASASAASAKSGGNTGSALASLSVPASMTLAIGAVGAVFAAML